MQGEEILPNLKWDILISNIKYKPLLESCSHWKYFQSELEGELFSILQHHFMKFGLSGNQKQNNPNEKYLLERRKAGKLTTPLTKQKEMPLSTACISWQKKRAQPHTSQLHKPWFCFSGVCLFHATWILSSCIKTAFLPSLALQRTSF